MARTPSCYKSFPYKEPLLAQRPKRTKKTYEPTGGHPRKRTADQTARCSPKAYRDSEGVMRDIVTSVHLPIFAGPVLACGCCHGPLNRVLPKSMFAYIMEARSRVVASEPAETDREVWLKDWRVPCFRCQKGEQVPDLERQRAYNMAPGVATAVPDFQPGSDWVVWLYTI